MIYTTPLMKFICSFNNKAEKFQLPITPPSIEVSMQNNNSTLNINEIGEILIIGKSGLMKLTIESFFPNQDYYFADVRYSRKPYEYVNQILKWKNSGKPMRLAVVGTPINHPFAIESFVYKEEDGTGDVKFSLELKEYKFLNETSDTVNENNELKERTDERDIEQITVYPGDDPMDIALRSTGGIETLTQCKMLVRRGISPGQVLEVTNGKIYL